MGAVLAALTGSGCWTTDEWPEPMGGYHPTPTELEQRPGGPLEVTVFRHSDPVQVRRASSTGAFPLRFFKKRERVQSGGMMLVGPGGRGEVIWSDSGANAVLFDEGAVLIGEPGRGEPTMTLMSITRGQFLLAPTDRLRLLGGAELTASGDTVIGPFVVEHIRPELLRVRNQTKQAAQISYLDEVIDLGSAQLVDLPLLPNGVAPFPRDPDFVELVNGVKAKGAASAQEPGFGVEVNAAGESEVLARGVWIKLEPGDSARFLPLGQAPPAGSFAPPASEPISASPASEPETATPPDPIAPDTPGPESLAPESTSSTTPSTAETDSGGVPGD